MTPAVDNEAVRLQLARVCQSEDFAETTRAVEFLHFVIEEALAGRSDRLSQRVLQLTRSCACRPVVCDVRWNTIT